MFSPAHLSNEERFWEIYKVAFATLNKPPRLRAILETLMRADTPPWLRRGVRLPIFASRYHVCPIVSWPRRGVLFGCGFAALWFLRVRFHAVAATATVVFFAHEFQEIPGGMEHHMEFFGPG